MQNGRAPNPGGQFTTFSLAQKKGFLREAQKELRK
jgi:hypothetical protein